MDAAPAFYRRRWAPDALAVLALVALWLLYFWRLFTPTAADALSLREGDFSGQFVAFMSYQTERLGDGEVPLWNPYNNGGHPFLADTQSAVFYPPRLLTVAWANITDRTAPGELYAALQNEMALHVLLGSLLMYAFVRRLTARDDEPATLRSVVAGLVAALTFGYGGYLSGYPPLQLAVLEAGVWLPLVLLGIFQATRGPRPGWLCIVLAGVALGLSLLAGHPQTSLFTIYVALAFLAVRLWQHQRARRGLFVRRFVLAAILLGVVAGGLAAVQLLPGLEYTRLSTREELNVDDKGNGFPFQDIAQVLFPGFVSEWSPLYVGIAGLALAVLAVWKRAPLSLFFGITALIGLGLSFGKGTILYDVAYLLVPGASWFRGQERAAFLIAHSASVLAGLGTAIVLSWRTSDLVDTRRLRRGLLGLALICTLAAGVWFVLWRGPDGATYEDELRPAVFAALLAWLAVAIVPWIAQSPRSARRALLLVALVAFDLFSVTQGGPNYESIPAGDRLAEPAMVAHLRDDLLPPGARVDGQRGVRENYGTLYRLPDINGTSPLRLKGINAILKLPDDRTWDLLAVRYVLRDWEQLMALSTIVDTAQDPFGPYNVHLLDAPRDFAQLAYEARVVGSDGEAYGIAGDPGYDIRLLQRVVLLDRDPGITLPDAPPDIPGEVTVTRFEPERITLQVEAPSAAVLALSLPDYPGWQATINGDSAGILRAYGGLSALALPAAGSYAITLAYKPWTATAGAIISLLTLVVVGLAVVISLIRGRRQRVTMSDVMADRLRAVYRM